MKRVISKITLFLKEKILNNKGFTIEEMIVTLVVVSIFFTMATAMIVQSSTNHLKITAKDTAIGVCDTALDDIYKTVSFGEKHQLIKYKMNDTITSVAGVDVSNSAKFPVGTVFYENGDYAIYEKGKKEPKLKGEYKTEAGFDPDLFEADGIDLGFKRIHVEYQEDVKAEYIYGLPYAVGYYTGMDLTLKFEKKDIKDKVSGEVKEQVITVTISGKHKDNIFSISNVSTSIRVYNNIGK